MTYFVAMGVSLEELRQLIKFFVIRGTSWGKLGHIMAILS